MNVTLRLEGADELRETLLAMEEGAGEAVLLPIVAAAAQDLKAIMAALAPYRTEALARGISGKYWKSGKGYAKFQIVLEPEVYYGLFQEFGLGDKRKGGPSSRVQKRRASYDATMDLYKRGYRSGSKGLQKSQAKRLKKLEEGKTIQGQRRPNMAAQPFIRPAIFGNREKLIAAMIDGIVAGIEAASGVNVGGGA